jgi:nicotinate dehydrogenase subunit A
MSSLTITVNGKRHAIKEDPAAPLLYVLRNELQLKGPKFGCGLSQCGACTVQINGEAVRSCVTPVSAAANQKVVTLEGLGTQAKPGRVQQAFIDEQAVQCGYCINGMIMQADALLRKNPNPGDAEIREALAGNLCRCGTHVRILRAVKRAAASQQKGKIA